VTVVTVLVRLFFIAHEAADAFAHPAFRAPSLQGEAIAACWRARASQITGRLAHILNAPLRNA